MESMEKMRFNTMQLDALREVSNIGAGNAATSMSVMMNKKIDMTVPAVNILAFDEVFELSQADVVYGVIVRVIGDIPGNVLIVINKDVAFDMIKAMIGIETEEVNELGSSVLCEYGNIISAGYLNAIAEFTGLSVQPSVPAIAFDMISAILGTCFIEAGQHDEYILDIETIFKGEDNKGLGIHFYYIPAPGSLDKILTAIGVN